MSQIPRTKTRARTPATVKVVVEHHRDGFVAYPVGMEGVVVAEGDTLDEALREVRSAIRFHIQTFGPSVTAHLPMDTILADVAVADKRTG